MTGSTRVWLAMPLMLAVSACTIDTNKPGTDPTKTSLPDRTRTIARLIGLPVPATAEGVFARYQQGLDDNARLVLLMSASDWAAMRARPPLDAIKQERYATDDAVMLPGDDGAWNPRRYPGLVAAQTPSDGRQVYNIAYVKTAPDRVRVFVFWHQM